MNPEPLTSVDDPDWLSLRIALWPDCPRRRHLEQMSTFLRDPARFMQCIVRAPGGQGVGFAEASVRTEYVNGTSSSPVAYLEGIYVTPEARGQGVARSLVAAVSEWAVAHGCTELASDTQPENLVSQAVHRQLGFVETERSVFFSKQLTPKNAA